MSLQGVVGFGISARGGEPVIVVYLESDDPVLKGRIPSELEGFRVLTEVTGPIEALPLQAGRMDEAAGALPVRSLIPSRRWGWPHAAGPF